MNEINPKPEYWVLSLSGGKDSTALGLEWLARHKADPVTYPLHEVVYCDTWMEFPAMMEHINQLEKIFMDAGIKFTRVQNPKSFDWFMFEYQPKRHNPELQDKKGQSWPGPQARWCTAELKTRIINRYLAHLREEYTVIQLIGLAADEEYRLEREHNQNPEHRHPLAEWGWTEADCLKYCYAQRSVQKEIESWYARFAVNNQISLTDARKWLTAGQLEEFHWSVEQYIKIGEQAGLDAAWLKKLENASARFHISRLEAVQTGIQQQLELLYGNQVDSLDALLKKVVGNGYTHTAFEVQKGVGLGWDITGLDQKKLETLLSKPWTTDGRTFSDRIWFKKQELVDSLQKELVQGLLRGDSPQKITDAIQKKFKVSRYQAARLVNTETSYFNALAAKETYKELGVKNVEILETLDSITCAFCASMDRKVVPMSEFQPGVTVPPFHPHCRGTTVPAIDEKYMGERAARDQDGKVYYVPGNMSYSEWKKTFVDNGSKDGLTLATIGSIIKNTVSMVKSEGSNVQTVGRIDIEKYRCITDEIATDEVIITPERIQHIEERHPGDYEQFVKYVADILENPDYILEANKPNTGVILKEIEENGEKFKVILRVKVESDPAEYRNSILSFWQIGETTWKKNVKNKKILYKRE